MYTVTIDYYGTHPEPERVAAPIAPVFLPTSSYVDLPVMKEGYPVDAEMKEGDTKTYGKSVYATNVPGWGRREPMEPYASTGVPFPVPLAQFRAAVLGNYDEEKKCNTVSFTVEDYKEAMYYQQLGVDLKDQGFEITVQEGAATP